MDDLLSRITEALVVRPGDTLVIRLDHRTSMAEFDEFRERIRGQLDPDIGCMIIEAPGAQILTAQPV